jgi:hypothetical protein
MSASMLLTLRQACAHGPGHHGGTAAGLRWRLLFYYTRYLPPTALLGTLLASRHHSTTARKQKDPRLLERFVKARAYLAECGHEEHAQGIIDALEASPGMQCTVPMLKAMGSAGLKSLATSVEQEQAARMAKIEGKARLHIRVPSPLLPAAVLGAFMGKHIPHTALTCAGEQVSVPHEGVVGKYEPRQPSPMSPGGAHLGRLKPPLHLDPRHSSYVVSDQVCAARRRVRGRQLDGAGQG